MSSGDMMSLAVRIYQTLGWTFLRATVGSSLFCFAALLFYLEFVLPSFFFTHQPNSMSGQMVEVATATAMALFVAAPLFLIGISFSQVVVTLLASGYILGNAPDVDVALSKAREKVFSILKLNLREILISCAGLIGALGLTLLSGYIGNTTTSTDATAGVVLFLGALGYVIGGLFFFAVIFKHALAPVAMTLENLGAKASAIRSATLLKKSGPYASGYDIVATSAILIGFLFVLLWGGFQGALSAVGYPETVRNLISGWPFANVLVNMLGYLPSFIVLWTLVPLWSVLSTIIYYERRIRLEGYDIEALAEDVWRGDRSRRFEL